MSTSEHFQGAEYQPTVVPASHASPFSTAHDWTPGEDRVLWPPIIARIRDLDKIAATDIGPRR